MNCLPANCPDWLSKIIIERGGILSFYDFMEIVLNDPNHGYYGSGKAKIGKKGDFVTSTALSDDFAFLLAIQIEDWLNQIGKDLDSKKKLTILEFGSGNGCLLRGIIEYFLNKNSEILKNISFKIIELNPGMIELQRINLNKFLNQGIEINWIDLDDIDDDCINGIVIAHEVLDAFAVERIQYKNGSIFRQGVELNKNTKTLNFKNISITENLDKFIAEINNKLGIKIPPKDAPTGWTTELHVDSLNWLENIFKKMDNGILLIIDYALDSKKYYSAKKNDGTILSYKNQRANIEILNSPGDCDLTCHLCSDLLIYQANLAGFDSIGFVKQGEALLLLGLAQRLYDIQKELENDLSKALIKREAILRLVDPICLGDFKWFIFKKSKNNELQIESKCIN
tara:strand:- start:1395 stop:2585 length:1191 start_codon:yes stop_codon:yes gene_type:complete